MRALLLIFGLFLIAAPALSVSAFAQTQTAPAAQDDAALRAAALKAREDAELRIESEMLEMDSLVHALSRNLGQMHYLRTLCFGTKDQKWRDYASRMMNLETGGDTAKRRSLIQAFNEGYYSEESRHNACSESVSIDAAALAENGRHLSSMLGDPYRVKEEN